MPDQISVTLVFYKVLSENQGRVGSDERKLSDNTDQQYTAKWLASKETVIFMYCD